MPQSTVSCGGVELGSGLSGTTRKHCLESALEQRSPDALSLLPVTTASILVVQGDVPMVPGSAPWDCSIWCSSWEQCFRSGTTVTWCTYLSKATPPFQETTASFVGVVLLQGARTLDAQPPFYARLGPNSPMLGWIHHPHVFSLSWTFRKHFTTSWVEATLCLQRDVGVTGRMWRLVAPSCATPNLRCD